MNEGVQIQEIVHGSKVYLQEIELRTRVLRAPLGLKFSEAELAKESEQIHFGAFTNDRLVGCLILVPLDSSKMKMRQVAVEPLQQGKGIGKSLVFYSERYAEARGFSEMELHARENAVPFYEALGYRTSGPPFIEIGLTHFKMNKALRV